MKPLFVLSVLLFSILSSSACSSPAGKVAEHKVKKVSPVHDTKPEKAKKKAEEAVPDRLKK